MHFRPHVQDITDMRELVRMLMRLRLPDGIDGFGAFVHRWPFESVPALEDMLAQGGYTAEMERLREPDGTLTRTMTLGFTRARRPAED